MSRNLYLIRFGGELSIKAKKTRNRFVDLLMKCLSDGLRSEGVEFEIERSWERILLHAGPEAEDLLPRIFGISSISRIQRRSFENREDVLRLGEEIFTSRIVGKTFAVKIRRLEKRLPFKSQELERELGSRLHPHSAGVDLTDPEIRVRIDLRQEEGFFYDDRIAGASGFPIGTEGRAVAMISGGFDSIVAAWMMLRRGTQLDYVFCNLGGTPHRDSALRALGALNAWSYGYRPRVHIVDFQPIVEELQRVCPAPLWQVVLKRQMMRAGEIVAKIHHCDAIVTGEAIGQVSSQTLPNLSVITQATEHLVLRPLLTAHKEEIVDLARKIGSYELSSLVPEYCALHPKNPSTGTSRKKVEAAEVGLQRDLLEEIVESRVVLDLRSLDLDRMQDEEIEVDEVADGVEVVDLRSKTAFASWHYPGAVHVRYFDALKDVSMFDREKTWLFYCEIGLKSAHLAEILRREGISAVHFQGGLKGIIRYSERDDPALRALLSPVLLD